LTLEVFNHASEYLGLAIVNLIHLINPEIFVIGGGLIEAVGEPFLKPAISKIDMCLEGTANGIIIAPGKLGDLAGILGAAAMARDRHESESGKNKK
jgi:glucokinase